MNIWQKIAAARVAFQDMGVLMSGENNFAGYKYYELSDILPAINKIGAENGFLCEVSFSADIATLTVRDTEKPAECAVFTSPMSEANLKGCHAVQNLGAVQTYIKRYLYQNAFEIVENDSLNKTHGRPEATAKASAPASGNEYIELKGALIDYINGGWFKAPDAVNKAIEAKDLKLMREMLDTAKAREAAGHV